MMFEEKVKQALVGKTMADPERTRIAVFGSDLGFGEGDIHHLRIYQMELACDEAGVLRDLRVSVVGELISPCSGYATEPLDEFDWQPLLDWCVNNL